MWSNCKCRNVGKEHFINQPIFNGKLNLKLQISNPSKYLIQSMNLEIACQTIALCTYNKKFY